MAEILEVIMVICFGASWPISIYKSLKSKSVAGKSMLFLMLIWIGYAFGIASKLLSGKINYVIIFYVINFCLIFIDICLYMRNVRLQKK